MAKRRNSVADYAVYLLVRVVVCVVQALSWRYALRLADGLACRVPDADALTLIRAGVDRIVQVSEAEIEAAMRIYFSDTHQIAEGAAAAGLIVAHPHIGMAVDADRDRVGAPVELIIVEGAAGTGKRHGGAALGAAGVDEEGAVHRRMRRRDRYLGLGGGFPDGDIAFAVDIAFASDAAFAGNFPGGDPFAGRCSGGGRHARYRPDRRAAAPGAADRVSSPRRHRASRSKQMRRRSECARPPVGCRRSGSRTSPASH